MALSMKKSMAQKSPVQTPKRPSLEGYVNALQARSRYTFTREQALAESGLTAEAVKKASTRLQKRRRLARLQAGFYVIVPIEYSATGIVPPEWFIDDLMRHLDARYYVGGLTAAAYHGASHQAAQVYQVVAGRVLRRIKCRGLAIQFLSKDGLERTATEQVKTSGGYIPVSTPEATAFDLVRYVHRVGGLSHVLTVLQELGERLRARFLVQAAQADGVLGHARRLGWLISRTPYAAKADLLADWVGRHADVQPARLDPSKPVRGSTRDRRWNLWVNTTAEGDLG